MNAEPLRRLHLDPLEGYPVPIGAWLAALEDTRRRTLRALEGLDEQTLHRLPASPANSVATLLYHIAAIEADWLYADVLEGQPFPSELERLLAFDVRDEQGMLTRVESESLHEMLSRLQIIRFQLLNVFKGMSVEEFYRPRRNEDYTVTPQWALHHLMQHEAEHRGQIEMLRDTLAQP
jgi:uncharacterized damage-inducible protein DinB